jgi:hypothetical protein
VIAIRRAALVLAALAFPLPASFALPHQVPVRVQVLGPAGAPVPDAWMTVDDARNLDPAPGGLFQFSVPPGRHEITALAWNQPPARIKIVAAAHPLDLELRFPPPGTISGQVTGVASGEEMTGVWARNERGDLLARVEIAGEGRYELATAGPGLWTGTVFTGQRLLERRVRLEAGGEATVDFRLPPLPEVRGRVLDVDGKPAALAEVGVSRGPNQAAPVQVKAGRDGRFAVHLVPGFYRMWASWPRSGPSPDLPLTVAGSPVDGLELRLSAIALVAGRVQGFHPSGEEFVPVWAERPSETGRVWGHWNQENGFTIFSLGTGDWIVSTQVDDRTVSAPVRIPPGVFKVAVDLKVPRGSARLEGSVAGWTPEQNLWVTARRLDSPGLDLFAPLERSGSFSFADLPPGRYRLRAGTEYSILIEETVQIPGKPVVLRPAEAAHPGGA